MYKLIKYGISILSFIGIILSLVFLIKTEYNAFSLLLIISIEYILLNILNSLYFFKKTNFKSSLILLMLIILGSILLLLFTYLIKTNTFTPLYLFGVIWIIVLEKIDRFHYKKITQ